MTATRAIAVRAVRAAVPPWVPVAAASLLVRLPLFFLPGAGRDEAAYVYWAFHPEPAYAPLLQVLVRFAALLPIDPVQAMRIPVMLGGVAVLYIFDRFLAARGAGYGFRLFSLAVLAAAPWQVYAGAVLHPDTLLLAALLALSLALYRRRFAWAVAAAAAAFWAKPTGLLALPVLLFVLWRDPGLTRRLAVAYSGAALALVAPAALFITPELVAAISEFSRIPAAVPLGRALLAQALAVLFLGGPLLLLLPAGTVRATVRHGWRPLWRDPAGQTASLLAMALLGAFALAALFNTQLKGNWILPAMVLLWPARPGRLSRPLAFAGLGWTLLTALLLSTAMARPDLVARFETGLPGLQGTYGLHAGAREARVSATGTWSQRLREYQGLEPFAGAVRAAWGGAVRAVHPPAWIVSDDYGLAAQLHFAWRQPAMRVIVPGDGVFHRLMPPLSQSELSGAVLVMAVGRRSLAAVWPRLVDVEPIATVPHPVTGLPVTIGMASGRLTNLAGPSRVTHPRGRGSASDPATSQPHGRTP